MTGRLDLTDVVDSPTYLLNNIFLLDSRILLVLSGLCRLKSISHSKWKSFCGLRAKDSMEFVDSAPLCYTTWLLS